MIYADAVKAANKAGRDAAILSMMQAGREMVNDDDIEAAVLAWNRTMAWSGYCSLRNLSLAHISVDK